LGETLRRIADYVGGELIGDEGTVVEGLNSLESAGPSEITFCSGRRYHEALQKTRAQAILINEKSDLYAGAQIIVANAELAYARVAWLFAPPICRYPGISKDAAIHETCRFGKDVSVYPTVYVGEGAVIGEETVLFPGVCVGENVTVGKRCLIYPNVSILRGCIIGDDVIIHPGTVIGSDGFGFVRDGATSVKIPQTGIVQIDDQVEIGANNCIDRATFGKTWIKKGVKTDNLVQIAHNVVVGENSIIVSQAGISGSCTLGKGVLIGGQVGVSDHVNIGDGVMVGSQSGIPKSIPAGQVVSGSPVLPHRVWLKAVVLTGRLPELNDRLRSLEKKIKILEKSLDKEQSS
jgi:UDP-3-O-[3-hydroxymyristoyl] glucosamine N-acyltransferase